jgi:DNA-directed RNA polymerase specialized sigma24 family protein
VFSLRFYHGWTFAEIATLIGASVPTARRRWLEAVVELRERLEGELPG